jgi:hypothetical protein
VRSLDATRRGAPATGEGASPVVAAALLLLSPATAPAKEGFEKPAPGTDLKALADAAEGAAKRRAAQWFFFAQWLFFVAVVIALAAIVGSTTHRMLFLEEGVRVPLLPVELPLKGFYVAAPAVLLLLHFYVALSG